MRTISAVVSLTMLSFNISSGQWVQSTGPYGGYVFSLASTSNNIGQPVLYAGAFGAGIFRSSDLGLTWNRASDGITHGFTLTVAAQGDIILAGTRNAGMYRSSDGGGIWTQVAVGLFPNDLIYSIVAVHTGSPAPVYFAAVEGAAVHRSDDGGVTWVPTGSPPCLTVTQIHVLQGPAPMSPVLFGNFPDGIFSSTDLGATWTLSNTGLGDLNIWAFTSYALANGTTRVFASANDSIVYVSTNLGQTWDASGLRRMTRALAAVISSDSTAHLFAGTLMDGAYRSDDHGATWIQLPNGLPHRDIRALAVWDTLVFACPFGGGIFKSTDLGNQWIEATRGLNNLEVRAMIRNPLRRATQLFAGSWGGGVFRSDDRGLTWNPAYETLQNRYVLDLVFRDSILFAGVWGGGGVYKTSNLGEQWLFAGLGGNTIRSMTSLGRYVFAGTADSGLFRTTDDGATWIPANFGPGDPPSIGCLFVDASVLYAGTIGGTSSIYRSLDSGSTWVAVGPPGEDVVAFAGSGSAELYAGTYRVGDGILRSTDNGITWSAATSPSMNVQGLHTFGEHLFVATRDAGVHWSSNRGTTWIDVNTGLPSVNDVKTVFEADGYLIAGTGFDGIWRRALIEIITTVEEHEFGPTGFALEQNYPNPFNPATRITYSLPSASHVSLVVYDMLGREVAVLVNEIQQRGKKIVEFSGNGLSSGIYFCRLTAAGYHSTRKMILMK